jgi:starvation-inducible outer membrane lipoprotein
MKTRKALVGLLAISGLVLLQGCIAFPPLIQVEHKDNPANQDLMRRLDAIEHRLDAIEQKQK